MAVTDGIILQYPDVIILVGTSTLGGVSTGEINFGSIAKIYATSDKYAAGQNVSYTTFGQRLIIISRYTYAIVKEENILYAETALP